jgi:hypothetical protein
MNNNQLFLKSLLTVGLTISSPQNTLLSSSKITSINGNYLTTNNQVKSTRLLNNNAYSLDRLKMNITKLNTFKSFQNNWDGYYGDKINNETILFTEHILKNLTIQPQVFPTNRGTIQIEKYFNDSNFYEVEINGNEVFIYAMKGENEIEKSMEKEEIINFINSLYA